MEPTNTPGHGPTQERLIDLREYLSITGESRTVAYERMKSGVAPAPLKDGRASRWVLSEVQSYLDRKIASLPKR